MQIVKCQKRNKCFAFDECEHFADYELYFGNKKIFICNECLKEYQKICSAILAPRSIKSKFNKKEIYNGRSI